MNNRGVSFNGDLFVEPHDTHAENVYSNWYVKTKYLEATAGAVSNRITMTFDLAMLKNKKHKVDNMVKNTWNIITIADNAEIQGTWLLQDKRR